MPQLPPLQTLNTSAYRQEVTRLWPGDVTGFPLGFGLPYIFGDGSDGDVTVTGTTNIADMEIKRYRNLTINSGGTLGMSSGAPAVMVICVRERLYVVGTISMDGKGGLVNTNYADAYGAAGGGGGGGNLDPGVGGQNTVVSGGSGGAVNTAGSAGASATTRLIGLLRMRSDAKDGAFVSWGAAGGFGGSGNGPSGARGVGGGGLIIFASEIYVDTGGIITANGNNSVVPTGTDFGGSGAGGGGFVYLITRRYTNNGTVRANGGTGSAGTGTGGAGGNGGTGTIIAEVIPV